LDVRIRGVALLLNDRIHIELILSKETKNRVYKLQENKSEINKGSID